VGEISESMILALPTTEPPVDGRPLRDYGRKVGWQKRN